MEKLRVLDLFSGIGGFSLGLERTGGFETVAFCEIEEFPRKVLAKHWPDVPCYDDVRTLTAERLAADGIAVDVITGGFPCQDVSNAAYSHGRVGIIGERSGLFAEIIRLAQGLAGPILILENVSALLRDGLVTVLQSLREIGYDAEWHTIPAAALGLPQARDRVWIIANPSEKRAEGPLQGGSFGKAGQGWQGRQTHLQDICAAPFDGGRGWPQPILRGVDVRIPHWVDRIGACGNAVVPQVVQLIGQAILAAETSRLAGNPTPVGRQSKGSGPVQIKAAAHHD